MSEAPDTHRPRAPTAYDDMGLDRGPANSVALTPLSFLERAATVYPHRTAIVYGQRRHDYADFRDRCRRLAVALAGAGVGRGDTVSVLLPNIPEMLECHFGVAMAGAVLNAINTRLDAASIAFFLGHAGSKVLIADRAYAAAVKAALASLETPPQLVEVDDPAAAGEPLGGLLYDDFLPAEADAFAPLVPEDEWDAISLSYTSGTTGDPKGVVYHHRGAYLNALSNVLATELTGASVYLWTLPMFHCNGWTFPWAVTAVAGTHVCLREVVPQAVFAALAEHRVTLFCGAPVVLTMLLHAPAGQRRAFAQRCHVFTGGAAPPSAIIEGMERLGFTVTQLYGLTESYGPSMISAWQDQWAALGLSERARLMARQGHGYPLLEGVRVVDRESGREVARDGESIGEIVLRGNTVMKGYLKNARSTAEALRGGWLHTGDLAVRHADGSIEIKDRAKDIIISGGENISSLEIEEVLYRHPAVMEAAVVARPDDKWGETPCAFVTLAEGAAVASEADIIAFCRQHMAHFKAPKTVIFGALPKTSTGKIMKYALREQARALGDRKTPA